jgi:hypothetical protein
LTWIPPDLDSSRIVTKVPKPSWSSEDGQEISVIRTRYPVNLDFHGNVIVYNDSGVRLKTSSDTIEKGHYVASHHGNYSSAMLSYPATPGSLSVVVDDIIYTETSNGNPESNQFFVDYENSKVIVKGFTTNIYIEYKPSYVFINHADPYKIMFYHEKVFGSYKDTVTIGYDYTIKFVASITDYSNNTIITKNFDLLALNHLSADPRSANNIYLEL